MSRSTSTYSRWSFNYPEEAQLPPGFVYGVSYALFGLDVLPGQIIASRAPNNEWEIGTNIYDSVKFSQEARDWFASKEKRPLLIMTKHGLALLSKRYYLYCGLGLLIHFHAPVTRAAAAACRGSLGSDWIVSQEVRERDGGRCDKETYLVMREAAYELTERLPNLLPQDGAKLVPLRTIAQAIQDMAAAIGCTAEEGLHNGLTPMQDVYFSRPLIWEAFLLYGLSLARRCAARDGTVRFTLNKPDPLVTEALTVRLDMDLESLRVVESFDRESTAPLRKRDDLHNVLAGCECLSMASNYNGAQIRLDVGDPCLDPHNRRLSLRRISLSMTRSPDLLIEKQLMLRTNAIELFKY